MNVIDEIVHTTVRIETNGPLGGGSGTAFFVNFCDDDSAHVPMLVTNKHVIAGATSGLIHFTIKKDIAADAPEFGKHVPVFIDNFQNNWLHHPDPNVDLAALAIAPLIEQLQNDRKVFPFYKAIGVPLIADRKYMSDLLAIEPVTMIGYPNGLWDPANNLPISRRGITATPPGMDFKGEPTFLIDCAVFPGSSGSPIFLLDTQGYAAKDGVHIGAQRTKLIGVLTAGHQYNAIGEITMVPAPTALVPIVQSKMFLNIGVCIKAEQLLWFEQHISSKIAAEKKWLAEQAARGNTGGSP